MSIASGACSTGEVARGYVFDVELANAITPGIDNQQSVFSTLGSPTIEGTFGERRWYYVSTKVKQRPVYWPSATSHRVLAIRFSDTGVVSDVTNYDLGDRRNIVPVKDKTPTRGRDLNLFQQLFSNIGRFSGGPQGGPGQQGPTRTPNG